MIRHRWTASRLVSVVVLLVVAASACSRGDTNRSSHESHDRAGLQDLASVEAFRARFDSDSAQPRLVLLLSPT